MLFIFILVCAKVTEGKRQEKQVQEDGEAMSRGAMEMQGPSSEFYAALAGVKMAAQMASQMASQNSEKPAGWLIVDSNYEARFNSLKKDYDELMRKHEQTTRMLEKTQLQLRLALRQAEDYDELKREHVNLQREHGELQRNFSVKRQALLETKADLDNLKELHERQLAFAEQQSALVEQQRADAQPDAQPWTVRQSRKLVNKPK